MVERIQEMLKGKRYLLILDDVWNTLDWEPLKATILEIGGSKGTTLLAISCDKNVVAKMETYICDGGGKITIKRPIIHPLQWLSKDDSWSLLMARMCVDNLLNSEKELMTRRMIEKCGGVPLAIRALGDLLRNKSIGMWKEIEECEVWMKEDEYGILPSLNLSFNYLPNMALKKCFSYCAIFKEDEAINKNQLIYMWMAQGFLHPYDEMELVGEEYFKYLLNCSFFQDAKMDKFGNVVNVQMHDLVLFLAYVVSSEDSTICKELNPISSKLRTYLHGRFDGNLDLELSYRHLRVLSVDEKLLLTLGSPGSFLKHLRYLHVTIDFTKISADISELYHLETLHIESKRYFAADQSAKPFLLPYIGHLVNLRHLIYTRRPSISVPLCIIPDGLRHLTSLQTLPAINLNNDWGGRLGGFAPLVNLRGKLVILHLDCIKGEEEARSFVLGNTPNIHELVLRWGVLKHNVRESQNEILEALQPHVNLAMLQVQYFNGTRLPRWLIERGTTLINLGSLTL